MPGDPVEFLDVEPALPHGSDPLRPPRPPRRWWLTLLGGVAALVLAVAAARSFGGGGSPKRAAASPTPVAPTAIRLPAVNPSPGATWGSRQAVVAIPDGCDKCRVEFSLPTAVLAAIGPLFRQAEVSNTYSETDGEGQLFARGAQVQADGGTLYIEVASDTGGASIATATSPGTVVVTAIRAGYRVYLRAVGLHLSQQQLIRLAGNPALIEAH